MGLDYYRVLNLTRIATVEDIRRSYRKLALQWHPSRHSKGDEDKANSIFQEVAEAYEVLSNSKSRAAYDQEGVDIGKKSIVTPHVMTREKAEAVFDEFFGTKNPFAGIVEGVTQLWEDSSKEKPVEPPKVEVSLCCTLEELYSGCVKTCRLNKQIRADDGELQSFEKLYNIQIGAGWKDGTQLSFKREANEVTGDAIFTVNELPHAQFRRDGDNLHYTARISLIQSLTVHTIEITTLDARVLHIALDEIVPPTHRKIVKQEGMPSPTTGQHGDLIIDFDIIFPTTLKDDQRRLIEYALSFPAELTLPQRKLFALAMNPPKGLEEEQLEQYNATLQFKPGV